LEWYDYYHDGTLDFQQRTAADRVKEEFWVSIFYFGVIGINVVHILLGIVVKILIWMFLNM
jgi:hypothetical protein